MADASTVKKPEIMVFAGPNGSGKTTITQLANIVGIYINADEIKAALNCSDLEAAQIAEKQRESLVAEHQSFTFETVLSTERNLNLLRRARAEGYFIRCIYIITSDPLVNLDRVKTRFLNGGHDVPKDKILSRYSRAIAIIPDLVPVCDIMHIYDNTLEPFRIFKKRKDVYYYWENEFWDKSRIESLTRISFR